MLTSLMAGVAAFALAADPEPAQEPQWSLGASLFLGGFSVPAGAAPFPTSPLPATPGARGVGTSLERRLGPGLWLEAGVGGSILEGSTRQEHAANPLAVTVSNRSADLFLGARMVASGSSAPAALSVHVRAFAFTSRAEFGGPQPGIFGAPGGAPDMTTVTHATAAGLETAISVERELIEGVALRVGTTLFYAAYAWGSVKQTIGESEADFGQNAFSAAAYLSPSLSVRVAF